MQARPKKGIYVTSLQFLCLQEELCVCLWWIYAVCLRLRAEEHIQRIGFIIPLHASQEISSMQVLLPFRCFLQPSTCALWPGFLVCWGSMSALVMKVSGRVSGSPTCGRWSTLVLFPDSDIPASVSDARAVICTKFDKNFVLSALGSEEITVIATKSGWIATTIYAIWRAAGGGYKS